MEKSARYPIHRRRPHNFPKKPALSSLTIIILIVTVINAFGHLASGAAYSVVKLQHLYANREGSSSANNGRGMSSEHFEMLKAHDRARHGRILNTIVDFTLQGTADPFVAGLYYTRIELGTPPRPYYVQIDTGSDILWVNCKPCNACPLTSGLGISLNFFDPQGSSTARPLSCIDSKCVSANQISESVCTTDRYCGYSFEYGDGSGTLGYYVSDELHYNQYVNQYMTNNSSALITFGCSYNQSGDLTKSDRAVDGIFGFGQNDLSVVSQLNSQGLAPKIFSHCLEGEDRGGGILVLGEITEPGMVYTPIVPSQPHYNLNLKGIAVNGQQLSIDPQVFATTNNRGTIVDCGTTLAYLAEEAYNPFVNSIATAVSQYTQPFILKGNPCFLTVHSIDEIFPSVTLYFEGAPMDLKPRDYLFQQLSPQDTSPVWCIGWQKSGQQATDSSKMTILGDLVLKDKAFVYDLQNQRIGWTNFDCSSTVNVSVATGESKSIDSGKLNSNGSPPSRILKELDIKLCYCFLFMMSSIVILYSNR